LLKIKKFVTYYLRLPIKKIDFKNIQKVNQVIANSKYTKEKIKTTYNINSKVIYPGVNPYIYKNLNLKRHHLLSVGPFNYLKGHHWIIQNLSNFSEERKPLLKIVGYDGKNPKYIQQISNKYHVKIKILQNISERKLIKEYNQAQIYINGAYKEPFGLTNIEAMSCETPVISVKEGGPKEVIKHGINGFLIDRNDQYKFKLIIDNLMSNSKLRRKLGENARKTAVNNFNYLNTANKFEKIFKSFS
jgi:glycosyltransferase involved in cell wall biosynthesis